ncbi:MAG: hypothetical protein AB7P02_15775 [Alphaproteobacteria bacterium]
MLNETASPTIEARGTTGHGAAPVAKPKKARASKSRPMPVAETIDSAVQAIIERIGRHIAAGSPVRGRDEGDDAYFDRIYTAWKGVRAGRRETIFDTVADTDKGGPISKLDDEFGDKEAELMDLLRDLTPTTAEQLVEKLEVYEALVMSGDGGIERQELLDLFQDAAHVARNPAGDEGDEVLLRLGDELERAWSDMAGLVKRSVPDGSGAKASFDADVIAVGVGIHAHAAEIGKLRARTLAGLRVKARALQMVKALGDGTNPVPEHILPAYETGSHLHENDVEDDAVISVLRDLLVTTPTGALDDIDDSPSPEFSALRDAFRAATLEAREKDRASTVDPDSATGQRAYEDGFAALMRSVEIAETICAGQAKGAADLILQFEAANLLIEMAMSSDFEASAPYARRKIAQAWQVLGSGHRVLRRAGAEESLLWPSDPPPVGPTARYFQTTASGMLPASRSECGR